jgi:hypothetical protein
MNNNVYCTILFTDNEDFGCRCLVPFDSLDPSIIKKVIIKRY